MKRLSFSLLIVFLLSGCAIVLQEKYPEAHKPWREVNEACVDINGIYGNYSIKKTEDPDAYQEGKISLANYLVRGEEYNEIIDEVEILQESHETIKIKAIRDGQIVRERIYASGEDFKCKKLKVSFKTRIHDTAGAIGWLFSNNRIELRKTENEDLVLKETDNMFGLMVIPPTPPFFVKVSSLAFFKKIK